MMQTTPTPTPKKRIRRKLLRVLDRRLLTPDQLALIAGDRRGTSAERTRIARIRRKRGEWFYVDALFSMTQREYPPGQARVLWHRIIQHKKWMSRALGRNPGYLVAAADYVCNVARAIPDVLLLPRPDVPALAEVALQDGLTQLYDQSAFRLKLEAAVARCRREGGRFSVVMMDVDNFKAFNDRYGHPQGSRTLSRVGQTIRREIRGGDVAARYGGEEFAILVDQPATRAAVAAAERVRARVARRRTRLRRVTLSAGVATYPRHARSARALIRKADEALYRAKRTGKDRVVVARG